jgi:hypothetical protein
MKRIGGMKMTQARPVTKTGRLDACVQVSGAKKIAVRRMHHVREANASGRKVNATSKWVSSDAATTQATGRSNPR